MIELVLEPRSCGYVVFERGDVCEWDPETGRLFAQEDGITLFADKSAAETAVERTVQSIKQIDSTYVAKQGDWRISSVRRVRIKEPPPNPASPKGAVP